MPTLSIIMPVYNESATFPIVLDRLISLQLSGIKKELIIIESNSTDGTREQAIEFHQKIQPDKNFSCSLILEDLPRGKGYAVRQGLQQATGDFVLIQDGDLEYDTNDYEKLLKPLLEGKADLVLGSRHSEKKGSWRIRTLQNERLLSLYTNFGHILFMQLFNVIYGQHLKDPFTMYKIFRRSCIDGMEFTANRFDFDIELLAKLCQRGYTPLEIPITYQSRSFSEGKQIRLFRDPFTWLVAILKNKFKREKVEKYPLHAPQSACYSLEENSQKILYDQIASKYHTRYTEKWSRQYAEKFYYTLLLENLNLRGAKVLDAMCGSTSITHKLIEGGATVTGLDISPQSLAYYAEVYPQCKTIEASILHTGIPNSYFDYVFIIAGLHHLHPNLSEALTEITRILKPGGCLCFIEPHKRSIYNIPRKLWYWVDPNFAANEAALDIKALKKEFADRYTFTSEKWTGQLGQFLIFHSELLHIPLWLKNFYAPLLIFLEENIPHFMKNSYTCTCVVCQWHKN